MKLYRAKIKLFLETLTSIEPLISFTTSCIKECVNTLTSLTFTTATKPTDGTDHMYIVRFKTGITPPTIIVPAEWAYKGDGCTNGAWTTVEANKYYELHGSWVLDKLVWMVNKI